MSDVNIFEAERAEALAVIGAYGADAARWPVETRAAVLALAASDAVVAEALAEARRLDGLLRGWAGDVPEREFEVEALIPAAAGVASPAGRGTLGGRTLRWFGGGAIAASVAMALLLGVPGPQGTGMGTDMEAAFVASEGGDISHQVSLGSASGQSELEGFALVFTPTAYEEDLI